MDNQIKNYGLLPDLRTLEEKARDYKFGADNGVVKHVLMPDSNWFDDTLIPAKQHGVYFDSMGCVSFSLSGEAEYVFNRMIELEMISQTDLDWLREHGYFDANNKINFSERYLAKMSGTTRQGNSLWKVADTARHFGFVPYSMWPFPAEQRTPVFDWDDFYAEIPQEIINLGKEFATRFNIQYEVVDTSDHDLMKESQQYAPVQVTIHAYPAPINGIYPKTTESLNHAVVGTWEDFDDQLRYIRDTYQDWNVEQAPYYKKLAWDYIYGDTGYILYFNSSNSLSQEVMDYLAKNENKLVQNTKTGAIGIIKGGKVLVTNEERAGLLALTAIIRQGGGGGVTDEMWEDMPKENF